MSFENWSFMELAMKSIFQKLLLLLLFFSSSCSPAIAASFTSDRETFLSEESVTITPSNQIINIGIQNLTRIQGDYQFAEGPVADKNGDVYFSDIDANRIYKWSPDGKVSVFKEGLNRPNGLKFDISGNLIVCEGGNGRIISLDPNGQLTILVSEYDESRFNEPNDLWVDLQGGIYFTDPVYQQKLVQSGEYVYYISPDRQSVEPVIKDLVKPNGIVGTSDGKRLFVADPGSNQIYTYEISADGSLSNKQLYTSSGSDGMALDANGNLYLTVSNQIKIFNGNGEQIGNIPIPENPTNLTFTAKDNKTLFITARTAVYTADLSSNILIKQTSSSATTETMQGLFTLTSPEVNEEGVLPTEYTCDGASSTLALTWRNAPEGTQSFALIMHHVASPDDIHWYWVLYDIPFGINSLPKITSGIGTLGSNSVNGKNAYTPPCSKGPGFKQYTYTIYALSQVPVITLPPAEVTRAVMLEAMQPIMLAKAELHVIYARK
jgi:gluconolactonase